MKCETIFISAIICSVIKQTNCKPSGKRADEEHGLATNEEVTGEHKMTFTKSQLKALFDKGIARGESEKTKERKDIKPMVVNNYACHGLCYNSVDLSENIKSKGKCFDKFEFSVEEVFKT